MTSPWDRGPELWILVKDRPPPEKLLVETRSENGMEQDLVLSSGLWWFPDMSMYVYYNVQMWRKKNAR